MIPINAAARAVRATASASERLVGTAISICARTLRMSVLALALLTACTEHGTLAPATDRTVEPVENSARQISRVSEPASAPPAIVARDDRGQPIAGARVTFTVTSGGGRIERQTAVTDASGIATTSAWTLGAAPGTNPRSRQVWTARAAPSPSPPRPRCRSGR